MTNFYAQPYEGPPFGEGWIITEEFTPGFWIMGPDLASLEAIAYTALIEYLMKEHEGGETHLN